MTFPETAAMAMASLATVASAALTACQTTGPAAEPVVGRVGLADVEGSGFAIRTHDTNQPLERVHEIVEAMPAERLTDAQWERSGLEVIRLRESDVPELLFRLPASGSPGLVWHGQALNWRNLQPPAVPVGDRVMVTDAQEDDTLRGGRAGLSGRGWLVMTLDGPRLLIEVAPRIELAGQSSQQFDGLRREFLIGPGDVLLLVAGSGQWPHPPPEDTSVEAQARAATYVTMGQIMLERTSNGIPQQRLILVTPRFGDWQQDLDRTSSADQSPLR
jgi:hypothetical protein